MLDSLARWAPAFDPATGTVIVPLWALAAAATAIIGLVCLFVFTRSGRKGSIGVVARLVLIALVAGATWLAHDLYGFDSAAERRALEARIGELAARALTSGSALACLDATAGETVEASCERAVFATPEATAAAASYVAAQLTLLADASEYARHTGAELSSLANLRRAVELDRFGLAARVLAVRDGCTSQRCEALALLRNAGRVKGNLNAGTYDLYVMRHMAAWPAVPGSPGGATASTVPVASVGDPGSRMAPEPGPQGASVPGPGAKFPLAKLFFPSSESIPAVNIMNAEPNPPAAAGAAEQPAKPPAPPRKPPAANAATAAAHPTPPARPKPPVDLNASTPPVPPVPTQ
jgi:hypothetical protein